MKSELWAIVGALFSAGAALGACRSQPAASVPRSAVVPPTTSAPEPAGLQVRWSVLTGGPIWEAATINDGTVYFGSDDGNLYALASQSGDLQWKLATEGIVRSRPAVAGGLVYVASDDGFLYAVHAQSGGQVWRTDIGNALSREQRENLGTSTAPTGWDYRQSSPTVAGDLVYVGSRDGNVYAVDAQTGAVAWTFQTGDKVRATPTVADGVVYIGSWDKTEYALNALTGEPLWQTRIGGQVQSTALVADGLVYCASRKASVVALDVQTGALVWEYGYGSNMWVESSPRLVNGVVYIGSSGSKWVLGLDSKTGKLSSAYFSAAFHWSTPAVVGDTLYIGGAAYQEPGIGGLYALTLTGGKLTPDEPGQPVLPVRETLEASGAWSGVAASPVTADGIVYFGALDGRLYAAGG